MERKCPNCGKELPEEASFCLFCFTDIDNYKKSEARPAVIAAQKASPKAGLVALKGKFNKKLFCRIGIAAAFLLVMGICIFAMKAMNSGDSLKPAEGTTIIEDTSAVAVTDEAGEAVTDEAGEQVFEIVDVTKIATVSTTEKQGFFDKIVDSITKEPESNSDKTTAHGNTEASTENTEDTTNKQGFFDDLFDNIFGDKEESTTEEKTTASPSTTLYPQESTEEHGTTSSPSTSQESATSSLSTSNPATTEKAEPSTLKPTTTSPAETPVSDFEYTLSAKYAAINKYIGNDKHVTVPAVIEGKYVTEINQNAFQDNPSVETVSFADDSKRPYLWIRARVFNNCENLKIINLPNTDLGIYNHFAYNCLKVQQITLKNNQYRYADGGLYYSGGKGWVLRYFCPASATTTLTLPAWSTGIEGACNLEEASNLKEIILHKDAKYFPDQSILPSSLENIFVDDNNQYGYDINGISFYKSNDNFFCAYPRQNRTTELTLPENSVFYGQYVKNEYLKTLRIPKTVSLQVPFYVVNGACFKNLETVYIQDGHPNQKTLIEDARVDNIYIY